MRNRSAYRVTIHSDDSLWHNAYLVVTPQRDSVNALAQACLRARTVRGNISTCNTSPGKVR